MTIQELETQVLSLNPVDKAKLISILTQTLTNGSLGIKKTPACAEAMLVLAILAYQFGLWCAIDV
jgi:ABC-type siderophore export system fused ATPase/permease subunit